MTTLSASLNRSLFSLVSAACCVLLAAAPALAAGAPPFAHARQVAPYRLVPAPVTLRTAGDKSFDLQAFRGKWVWLYFGFASCPAVCPTTLDTLAAEYKRLNRPEQVQMLFVSVDPGRDTPDQLDAYVGYFNPQFLGATADQQTLDALTRSLGTTYVIEPPATPGGYYNVAHPNTIFVLDPDGRLAATYNPNEVGHGLSDDFNGLPAPLTLGVPNSPVQPLPPQAPPLDTTGAWCGTAPTEGAADAGYAPLMLRAATLGSGTSVLPAASPMRRVYTTIGDWLWMLHGDAQFGLNAQGGPRGDLTWAAENWGMVMGSRTLGPGILDLRTMMSLEALTLPPGGTPQLFQTGETYGFIPIIDHQHPHDLFMELAARYTWNLDRQTSLFVYGGPVGEPALGPTAFMHRPSSADNHWAPLSHHQQDASHISYGVATLGLRRGDVQLEGSVFNGREPDEYRYNFDFGPMDSYAGRLSYFPGRRWAFQVSHGRLHDPEILHPGDLFRTTASATQVAEMPWGLWSSSFIWGQNYDRHVFYNQPDLVLQSYGLESQLDLQEANHVYGRYELVDKEGLPPGPALNHTIHRLNALTLGFSRDLLGPRSYVLAEPRRDEGLKVWHCGVGGEHPCRRPRPTHSTRRSPSSRLFKNVTAPAGAR